MHHAMQMFCVLPFQEEGDALTAALKKEWECLDVPARHAYVHRARCQLEGTGDCGDMRQPPPRPMSAFMYFLRDFRAQRTARAPGNDQSHVCSAAGIEWRQMNEAQRAPYVKMSLDGRQAYKKARETQENAASDVPREVATSGKSPSNVNINNGQSSSAPGPAPSGTGVLAFSEGPPGISRGIVNPTDDPPTASPPYHPSTLHTVPSAPQPIANTWGYVNNPLMDPSFPTRSRSDLVEWLLHGHAALWPMGHGLVAPPIYV